MRKPAGWAGRESGQGTVEYILVLAIIVIIIGSLIYQFNSSFRKYGEAFFDGYVACLLETGELPGVGGATCEMPSFDAKAGKGVVKDNIQGGEGGGANSKSKEDAKKEEARKAAARSSGGRSETAGSRSGSSYVGRFNAPRTSRVEVAKTEGSKDEAGSKSGAGFQMPRSSGFSASGRGGRADRVAMYYEDGAVVDRKEEDRPKSKKAAPKDTGEERLRASKMPETSNRATASVKSGEDPGFTIGALVRLFIILLIVIAMVIFFGGQLMQISRSREKGGGD